MLPITTDFALDALCLACFSSSEESKSVLGKIVEQYTAAKMKKNQVGLDTDMDVFIDIIQELISSPANLDKKTERNRIILKVKSSPLAEKDKMIAENVAEMLKNGVESGISKQKEDLLVRKLQNWVLISATNEKLLEGLALCRKYSHTNETQNDLILMNMLDKASEITKVQDNIIGSVEASDELDFSSKRSMEMNDIRYNSNKKNNVVRLGLQGLNNLLGANKGFLRGELVGIGAPSYGGKTLTLTNIARWATVLNKYELNDSSKKPLVLFVSLENSVSNNWFSMARTAYVNANHRPLPEGISREELIDINYAYYNKMGNRLVMKKFETQEFSFGDLLKLIARYEMSGYEVVTIVIDYIALMKIEGNDKDNAAKDIEKLWQKMYDLAQTKDILIVSGIQLDSTADRLISSGVVCPVKMMSSASLSDCKGIKKPLSVLLFQLVETTDDGSFMTWWIDKHRDAQLPRKDERFVAYRFINEELGIMDDFGGKDMSIRDIYATNNQGEEEKPQEDFFSKISNV